MVRRCVYGLALTSVETRDAMIAMMSDLRMGSASETSKLSSSEGLARLKLTSLLARLHGRRRLHVAEVIA